LGLAQPTFESIVFVAYNNYYFNKTGDSVFSFIFLIACQSLLKISSF